MEILRTCRIAELFVYLLKNRAKAAQLCLAAAMGVSEPLIQTSLLGEAIEHAPVPVFVADEEGHYVAVNQAACSLLGFSRAELLRLSVGEVAQYAEAGVEWDEMSRDGARVGRSTLTRKDGTSVEFEYAAGATTVAGMAVFVSVGVRAS
jgi:PAS domain S-box-containing protein